MNVFYVCWEESKNKHTQVLCSLFVCLLFRLVFYWTHCWSWRLINIIHKTLLWWPVAVWNLWLWSTLESRTPLWTDSDWGGTEEWGGLCYNSDTCSSHTGDSSQTLATLHSTVVTCHLLIYKTENNSKDFHNSCRQWLYHLRKNKIIKKILKSWQASAFTINCLYRHYFRGQCIDWFFNYAIAYTEWSKCFIWLQIYISAFERSLTLS